MSANKLASLNELFGELKETNKDEKDKVKNVTTKSLVPFNSHPFRLYTGRKLDDMVRSVKEFGILQPLIVRSYKSDTVQFKDYNVETNKYEILAGHNRWNAATIAEIEDVPIVIMDDLTDEESMLVVIETNLLQRSFMDLSYSERALVISEHYKSLKSQGRTNIELGEGSYINFNCNFVDDTKIIIGKKVIFGPAVTIATVCHPINRDYIYADSVIIEAGSTICPGVRIGENSVIGAGSIVTKDIPANSVAVGNPCRILRNIMNKI